jgi:hypothetical protein
MSFLPGIPTIKRAILAVRFMRHPRGFTCLPGTIAMNKRISAAPIAL